MSCNYDLIIVGAGVAGLRVGIEVLRKHPFMRCCILEKYNYIGGRIVTYRKDVPKVGPVQWENGAGRISTGHFKVLTLLKQYGLNFVPIPEETDFINDPAHSHRTVPVMTGNKFTDLIKVYLGPLERLTKETLESHTLKELLDKTYGRGWAKDFYEQFPYWAEIHTLRADLALEAFKNEMNSNRNFGVCAEGLSSLTDAMRNSFLVLGGTILMDRELYKVSTLPDKCTQVNCRIRDSKRTETFISRAVVLALHHNALTHIEGVKHIKVLKHLRMEPLVRMYAIFPVKKGVFWGTGLNKIVTNSPIRYIIPVDPKRGIVMISYTDGDDARFWIKQDESAAEHGEENVKDLVMTEIRKLFPERSIPNPIFFKQHPWYDGCTYWLPGRYNVIDESKKSLHPLPTTMPNLFMCGESFAVKQCWIESALDQADQLLSHPKFLTTMRKL
jgi:protoporphyrinogen oxidase